MSLTPETIINVPAKLLHYALGIVGAVLVFYSGISLLAGAGGLLTMILGFAFAFAADRVKYKYVKTHEAARYKRV